jgi:hypothetical protein
MSLVQFFGRCLVLSSSTALWLGCGGDSANDDDANQSEDTRESEGEGRPQMGEGPEGCYIEANFMCDCDLDEAACSEDVGIWTDGCATCAT